MNPSGKGPDHSAAETSAAPAGEAVRAAAADEHVFRLYITGATAASARAVVNARKVLERRLPGRYRLEILNAAEHVQSLRADQVVAIPTLIRLRPLPQQRFIGDLSDNGERIVAGLETGG